MTDDYFDQRRLAKVAEMYYLEHLSQQEISKRFGISRPHVSRLLKRAREEGIVTITIKSLYSHCLRLEEDLKQNAKLMDCCVIPATQKDIKKSVGEAAADYLDKTIHKVNSIGVAWGTTLLHFASSVRKRFMPRAEVLPLVGGLSNQGMDINTNEIVRLLGNAYGCNYYTLNAPAIVESESIRDVFLSSKNICSILEKARKVDLAFVGISSMTPSSTLVKVNYLSLSEIEQLRKNGVVGGICSRFFYENGHPYKGNIDKRIIGIDINDLKKMPLVFALAVGNEKIAGILGAIRGGYMDVLFTDEFTADSIISSL